MSDPWGVDEPPAVDPDHLPPLPEHLTWPVLLAADPVRRPVPADLPEVAALLAEGFEPLDDAPLWVTAPAVWPPEHRRWVPDRLPRVMTRSDGVTTTREPWDDEGRASIDDDRDETARAAGLPAPPRGRLWLLRSPWPDLGLDVALAVVGTIAQEHDPMLRPEGLTTALRTALALAPDEAWQRLPPFMAPAADAWRRRGVVGPAAARLVVAGLGPEALDRLTAPGPDGSGLSVDQALAWWWALGGPDPDDPEHEGTAVERVQRWRGLGLPADPPQDLDLTGDPADALPWVAAGFGVRDAQGLGHVGLARAIAWRDAGFDAEATRTLLLADPAVTPAQARAFADAGIADAGPWLEAGFDAAQARAWREVGVPANEARVWRSAGLGPADVPPGAGDGHEPVLPPGVHVGWFGYGPGRAQRSYGVVDPPGTRGRIAREARERGGRGPGGDHPR